MKRTGLRLLLLMSALLIPIAGFSAGTADADAIRQVLHAQVDAWNRGDVNAFMEGYDHSPETAFVGKTVEHGYGQILDRYRRKYGNREQMGTLRFDDVDVRELNAQVAVVTGRFHLTRSAAGGGDAAGIFSLVFERSSAGWKIVLDHTS